MSRLRAVAAGAALLALLAVPAAQAHQGNPNYRSVIDGIIPNTPGVKLQVLNFDDRLQLDNRSGKTIMVQGYQREPYARVLGRRDRRGQPQLARVLPQQRPHEHVHGAAEREARRARRSWKIVDRTGRFQWHDHRIHWMGTHPPQQVTDKSKRTKVFDWKVPMQVGATKANVTGTLFWQPKPGGGIPTGALIGARRARRARPRRGRRRPPPARRVRRARRVARERARGDGGLVNARARIGLALVLAALGALVLAPAAAQAHATLEGTSPERGAVVKTAPRAVTFRFDEPVEGNFGAVRVYDAKGRRVDDGKVVHPGGRGSEVGVGLRARPRRRHLHRDLPRHLGRQPPGLGRRRVQHRQAGHRARRDGRPTC